MNNSAVGLPSSHGGLRQYRIRSVYWNLHERDGGDRPEFLAPYFADLHRFFMEKMDALPDESSFPIAQETRLKELFDEVLKVKALLVNREDKW